MLHAQFSELPRQVGHHAAGHLVIEMKEIVFSRRSDRQVLFFGNLSEMSRNGRERVFIDV